MTVRSAYTLLLEIALVSCFLSVIVVLTGEPGSGKSTVLIKSVKLLKSRGTVVGGVYSRELRSNNVRVGFELEDAGSGLKGILASTTLKMGPKVGKYRVNLKDLASVAAKALHLAVERSDIIVCDEVGPMELYSPEFRRAVKAVIDSGKPLLAVVHKELRDPLAVELKSLSRSVTYVVDSTNRDSLPGVVAEKLSLSIGHEKLP